MGKILGQGGENVKRLQEMAGCRIAVLGRGSMKDKNKVRRQIVPHSETFNEHLHSMLHSFAECAVSLHDLGLFFHFQLPYSGLHTP